MPPIFRAERFEFAPGEPIPDHEDRDPMAHEVGTTEYSVQECTDRTSGICEPIAVELGVTPEIAMQLKEARSRKIAAECFEQHHNIHTAPHVAVQEPVY